MKIVINSSPLIFLVKLQFLELFLESDDEFYIPPAVLEEIQAKSDEVSLVISPLVEVGKLMVVSTRLLSLVNRLIAGLEVDQSSVYRT